MTEHERKRRRIAWLLCKKRAHLFWNQLCHPRLQRDIIGTLLADGVSCFRLARCAMSGHYGEHTEIERRAIVNARKRVLAKIEREKQEA